MEPIMSGPEGKEFHSRVSWWAIPIYCLFYVFPLVFLMLGVTHHGFRFFILSFISGSALVWMLLYIERPVTGISCSGTSVVFTDPLFLKTKMSWSEIRKVQIIYEGDWLGIVRVFGPNPPFRIPFKILTRTFPKKEMMEMLEWLKNNASQAEIKNVDLLKKDVSRDSYRWPN
ncbi:MAG TPA: hypothetical protein VFR02_06010 [bacterium]|nr:hypothetical protein [bacterium]